MTPSARSTKLLTAAGYRVGTVERFVGYPPPGHRLDLFGFVDLIAIRPGETLAIQTCSATDHSKRVAKIYAAPALADCLAAGWRVEVHSWRKFKRTGRWEVRREVITWRLAREEKIDALELR